MPNFDLKFFMREDLLQDQVVEVPGIDTFKDPETGEAIPLKIRALGTEEINDIRKAYTKNRIVIDEKGKRVFDRGGKPVLESETDNVRATNRMIVDALVFPNLHDPDLMKFYKCVDVVDMPFKVFKKPKDYNYVSNAVTKLAGVDNSEDEVAGDELVDEAKN